MLLVTLIIISSCSNIKATYTSENLKRINNYNSNGEIIKTFYKKYDERTDDWYLAKCEKIASSFKCNFTGVSLNLINLRKEKDNLGQSNSNEQDQSNNNEKDQSNNNEQDQSNNNEQDQSNNNEQETNSPSEFLGFEGGCIGCENFND